MTKDELRQYRSIKVEISQIEHRIRELERIGRNDDVTQSLRDVYRQKLIELIEGQLRIEKVIEGLDPTKRELMRLRYLDGKEWLDVAEGIHYEWTQTHRIYARALVKIKDL
jgi:DNA-directed RNA polymerase specialized sigma24 family protein